MLPDTWEEILAAPAYLITVDSHRYEICKKRITRAGYFDIQRFQGVDRENPTELDEHWNKHPFEVHLPRAGSHATAVLLAHLNLWKHIIDHQIPYATIFEDDTLFHSGWHELALKYYRSTPKIADMIYMGHHCGNAYPEMHIAQVPVYCLNAYIITYEGATKMYDMMMKYPLKENFGVIDMMLSNIQTMIILQQQNPYHYVWYAWNTQMFPDTEKDFYKHPDSIEKDKGLVFQQYPCQELPYEMILNTTQNT